jgi:hypothetical protein
MTEHRRLLVVTGAGASTALGIDDSRLPMMRDWAKVLHEHLEAKLHGLPEGIGLQLGMDAPDFEAALGDFLAFQNALPLFERFKGFGGPDPVSTYSEVQRYLDESRSRAEVTTTTIAATMYHLFGSRSIDRKKAAAAVGWLLQHFNVGPGHIVFATTNYDPSLELGILGNDLRPMFGFTRPSELELPYLAPSGMIDWENGHGGAVPVIHLHGGVGWYYEEEGGRIVFHTSDQDYTPVHGTPAYLPPDPRKDPAASGYVGALWQEFDQALAGASGIVVIGHSLNDPPLLSKIHEASYRIPVVITHYSDEPEHEPEPNVESLHGGIWANDAVHVGFVTAAFGPEPRFSPALRGVLDKV